MDLTQGSKTSEPLVPQRTPPQSGQVEPIDNAIDVLGLWQDKLHPPMEPQPTLDPPSSRTVDEVFFPSETDGPDLADQVEEGDPLPTSTLPPTSITNIEDATNSVTIVSAAADTTPLPETDKKTGLKSARSLPEERLRPWPDALAPENDVAYARSLEALPYFSQDAGLAQWSDMQKKSSIPVPAFDPNKWLEALRAQYQLDKAGWANRAAEPAPARNPRPFLPGTESQSQFLVVNNRGVVIPNSVQFPEVVKSAAYPQLQTYRYPQTSRNIQDILRYVTGSGSNRVRQTQWPTAVKKAAKVSGMYVTPNENFGSGSYMASRPEAAFLAATTASTPGTPTGGKPLNGHAYISDPFHPYKPADPTEINHLADHNPAFGEGELPAYTYPGKSTKHSHLRSHFGKQAQPTPYTTAVFKPLGNADQMATSTANVDSMMQSYFPQQPKRGVPPLSVMLEIYPMSSDDTRATVPFRGTATSNVFRRPGTSMSLFQNKEPSVRRPITLAVDASVASSQTVNVPMAAAPLQFQTPAQQQGTPAFGLTLSGLPPLPGMGPADPKHKMVVHLNFYPKKSTAPVVPRLRDPAEDLQAALAGHTDAAAAAPVFPADYPQRRQSAMNGRKHGDVDNASQVNAAKGNYFPGNSVVQAEFDASSLASVLPKDVVQRFSEFLRAAASNSGHQTNYDTNDSVGDFGPESTGDREDPNADEDDDFEEDSDEEDDEDEEQGRVVPYPEEHRRATGTHRRHPPMLRAQETSRVPFHRLWRSGGNVSWSDVQYDDDDDEDEDEDGSIGEIQGRDVGDSDTSPKMNIMPGNTKVTVVREKGNETRTTTEKPHVDADISHGRPYKPRRRLIIEASPKNHRMQ